MMIVREDAGDIELLRSGGELECADQRSAYVVRARPVAAQQAGAFEMEHGTWGEVLQCGCEVASAERRIRIADPLHVRMLGHLVLPWTLGCDFSGRTGTHYDAGFRASDGTM